MSVPLKRKHPEVNIIVQMHSGQERRQRADVPHKQKYIFH